MAILSQYPGRIREDPYNPYGALPPSPMPTDPTGSKGKPSGDPYTYDTGEGEGFGMFEIPQYGGSESPAFRFGKLPTLSLSKFNAPTAQEAWAEPGYQFRLQSGTSALERAAAAKGILRGGGTLRDLMEYGQNFASSEFSNVFDRAMKTFEAGYKREKDLYAPLLEEWKTKADAEKARGLAAFQREWDVYNANLQAMLQRESFLLQAAGGEDPGAGTSL